MSPTTNLTSYLVLDVIDPREKPTAIFLSQYNFYLYPKV